MKQLFVELPDEIVQIIDKELVGKLGEGYSDTLRTIIATILRSMVLCPKQPKKKLPHVLMVFGRQTMMHRTEAFLRDSPKKEDENSNEKHEKQS